MYIVNDVTARIFNTDNLQVILISPNDDTEIVGVMVDYEDYTVICKCTSHQTARSVWRDIVQRLRDGQEVFEICHTCSGVC